MSQFRPKKMVESSAMRFSRKNQWSCELTVVMADGGEDWRIFVHPCLSAGKFDHLPNLSWQKTNRW